MTRELLFLNSFEPQLAAFTSWKDLSVESGGRASTLAPSDYPGFEILPGEARYLGFDAYGFPISGEQDFLVRVLFAHPQLALDDMRSTHSDYVSLIEGFFSGGYILPPVDPGDVARIDSVHLQSIDPPITNKTATHTAITVHASYSFTLF